MAAFIVAGNTIGNRSPVVSAPEKDRLRDAITQIQKAKDRAVDFHGLYWAIVARCYYILGEYSSAAEWLTVAHSQGAYKILHSEALNERRVEQLVLERLTVTYIRAGKRGEADATKKKLFDLGTLHSQSYRDLAEEEAKQAHYQEAYAALMHIRDLPPQEDNDWLVSTLFAMNEFAYPPLEQTIRILEAVDRKRDPDGRLNPIVEGMLSAFFLPFARLEEPVRGLLVRGYKALYAGGDFEGHHGEGFFSCAVALESCLKDRILLQYEISIGQPGWFTSFLDRRPLTLGAMVLLIDREMDNEPALDGFKKWLMGVAPNLQRAIREQGVSVVAQQSNGYRHMAREIDCATARKLANACLTVLSSLYKA